MVKRLFLGLVSVIVMSCSSGSFISSDSDAYMQYNRAAGSWEIIWTWHLRGGKCKTDTIRIIDERSTDSLLVRPEASGSWIKYLNVRVDGCPWGWPFSLSVWYQWLIISIVKRGPDVLTSVIDHGCQEKKGHLYYILQYFIFGTLRTDFNPKTNFWQLCKRSGMALKLLKMSMIYGRLSILFCLYWN